MLSFLLFDVFCAASWFMSEITTTSSIFGCCFCKEIEQTVTLSPSLRSTGRYCINSQPFTATSINQLSGSSGSNLHLNLLQHSIVFEMFGKRGWYCDGGMYVNDIGVFRCIYDTWHMIQVWTIDLHNCKSIMFHLIPLSWLHIFLAKEGDNLL